jgi:fatty-acyl-CoA synthase
MQKPISRTMFELLREQAAAAPQTALAITANGRVSYSALEVRAQGVARGLRGLGVRRGDRIGLLCDNRVEWLEVFFAAAAVGAVAVPFSTWSTPRELDFLLSDSGVRLLFAIPRFRDRDFVETIAALRASGTHPQLENVILLGTPGGEGFEAYSGFGEARSLPSVPPEEGPRPTDPAVILYTSGSSNRPKAVPLDHFGMIENGFNIGERQGLVPGDRVLVSIPLFWSYGAVNALPATLTHGATLVMQGHFEGGGALDLIEREKCTAIYTLPAMTNALVAHPAFRRQRTASLRAGVTIGAPQDVIKAAQQLGAEEICNIYGATENYGNCCVTPHDWPLDRRAMCQGMPLPGVQLRIRDPETGREVGSGETGEIEVRGYLTQGYLGDSAQFNATAFTSDGFFKTGDLGFLQQDGALHYKGRSSEMIKRSGINVSPAEVEEVLQQHPSVALAGVTGISDPSKGELIVAYLTVKPETSIDVEAILEHCRTHLSRYKVPDRVHVCESLPLTPTGKLMRRELGAMAGKVTAPGQG